MKYNTHITLTVSMTKLNIWIFLGSRTECEIKEDSFSSDAGEH